MLNYWQTVADPKRSPTNEFAHSLLTVPKKGQADSLSKIERDAIAFAKKLLGMFKT